MKAIFWDLDGVLIDSMSVHALTWQKSLAEFGLKSTVTEMRRLGGVPFPDTILRIAKQNNKKITADDIEKIYSRKLELLKQKKFAIKPFPIYEDLLAIKQRGVKQFVVTGSIRAFAKEKIDKFFPDIFDGFIFKEDVKQGKPHPDPYLAALKRFGCKRADSLIVEDSPLGIASGKAAGIQVFAIATSLPQKYLLAADIIFDNHQKLFRYLKKIF